MRLAAASQLRSRGVELDESQEAAVTELLGAPAYPAYGGMRYGGHAGYPHADDIYID